MGSAIYYAKWKYETKAKAKKAFSKISAFIEETGNAHDYWQANRGKTPIVFWPEFKQKFPNCYEFLSNYHLAGGDCNNALAGIISVGDECSEIEHDGLEVRYASETWHFADWDPIVSWLVLKTKAESSGWLSDENANLFNCIEMK